MLKPILGAVAIGLALSAHVAAAAPVTVLDPSFELPALAGPGTSNGPTGGIADWTTSSTGNAASAGVWYLPQAPYFTIGAPVGNQVAFVYSGTGATGSGLISQTTSAPFQTRPIACAPGDALITLFDGSRTTPADSIASST